ncbi:lytic transglycosylase domain-containing protein [Longimicrobium sp.]|uniref:lytic transglycosylase domain-containing protein n=1 Tax=Longimicrobium sp. TaxID=2029185 RepID=UPI003B3AAFBB
MQSFKRPPPPWQRSTQAPQHPVGPARRRFPHAAEGAEPPARYQRAFDGAGDRQIHGRESDRRVDAGVQMRRRPPSAMDRMRRSPVRHGVMGLAVVGAATPLAIARSNQMRNDPAHERQISMLPEINPLAAGQITENAVGQAWRDANVAVAEDRSSEKEAVIKRNIERYKEYTIPRDLAENIYDIALEEDIDPDMAFGLVRTESAFKTSATSHVGAIGLTQLMPATARWLKPDVTVRDLREPETNLRIGFKYLAELIDKYDGDKELALLAYNRGPGTVDRVLKRGGNPDNGYPDMVLRDATPDAHPRAAE